jgi:hypothetical protein
LADELVVDEFTLVVDRVDVATLPIGLARAETFLRSSCIRGFTTKAVLKG